MTQPTLFEPRDPHLEDAEKPRLSAQSQRIFDLLQKGPATNTQLASIALKYTSRISDLRAAGIAINILSRDTASGLVVYALPKGSKP